MKCENCFQQLFCFAVFILVVIIAMISLISLFSEQNIWLSMVSLSLSNSNQYCVSSASFKAIDNLLMKSALLCEFFLSLALAPMLVPLLRICLDRTNSFFSSCRYLNSFIMRNANALLFWSMISPISFPVLTPLCGLEAASASCISSNKLDFCSLTPSFPF